MRKKYIKGILIVVSILLLFLLGIPIWNRIFFFNESIAKDYKIKQVPFIHYYSLYDKDDKVFSGIEEWIIERDWIHGASNSKYNHYFIHNMKTKKTFYFSRNSKNEYLKLLDELNLGCHETMYDDLNNHIKNWHCHLDLKEQEEFKKLSTEMKINTLFDKYIDSDKIESAKFYDYLNILSDDYNIVIPILLQRLNSIEIFPKTEKVQEFDIIREILFKTFYRYWNLLTDEQIEELKLIIQLKLDKYLLENNLIDDRVEVMDAYIVKNDKKRFMNYLDKDKLLKKYTDMGYKNLKLKNIK